MPTSKLEVAPKVLNLVWEVRPVDRPLRLVDVGPGRGKYALLIREYVDPAAELVAIEAWAPYVVDHRLGNLYDEVLVADVLDGRQPGPVADRLAWADVVLMVDVLEHLPKAAALELLEAIPSWAVVCTPRDFFHNGDNLPPTEAHVSHWTLEEFRALPRFDGHAIRELAQLGALIIRLRPPAGR